MSSDKKVIRKPNFMFKIPIGYMTEDIKKSQKEVIHTFMLMRNSVKSGADKKLVQTISEQFDAKIKAYSDAIVKAMLNGPFDDELNKKHPKKE